jgi:hypothetical protein
MHHGQTTSGFLRILEGFGSKTGSADARPPKTGYLACIEQSSFGADITNWLRKKSYYIRLGSVSAKGYTYRSQNFNFGSNGRSSKSDGV